MTESEIKCLKDNVDKLVEIETIDGELLVVKVVSVFDGPERDEHEVLYEVVSTNMLETYKNIENASGYALDFSNILSAKPCPGLP